MSWTQQDGRRLTLAMSVCAAVASVVVGQEGASQPPSQTQPARESVREAWTVRTEQQAIARAREITGLPGSSPPKFSAEVTTLAEDNTPFLHAQIEGRPIWKVVIAGWMLDLKSGGPDEHDRFARTFDVFIDPIDGKLLKAVSRWPEGVPPIAPQPSAQSAEEQMPRSDDERYHGFPDPPPLIDLVHALDIVQRDGSSSPYLAKQIIAHYVMESTRGGKPRPVWAITHWGIPPFEASYPGVPVDARNHMRTVVNAETGKCLFSTTTPQPEKPGPAPEAKPKE
jgi:hypothetical protein